MKRKSAPSVCSGPSRAVALAVLCGLASGASAQMWDGGAGSLLWTDGDNWEPDGVPGTMDDVLIDVPGVLIASIVAEVNSLSAPQLSMTSANLIVHDISTIDGLTVGGCCVTTIESNAMFTLTGVSEFSRAANFRGSGPFNLMQNQIFLEGFFVQGGTTVEIKGSASLVTNGSVRSNGVARVTGDLNLTTSLIEAQTDGVWELAGGTISKFGTGAATITAPLRMTAGEIVADGGTLDITGRVNFEAGTLSIANGGKIEINNGSSPTLNATRYEGDGDSIEIRGTYDLLSDGGSATSTVTGIRGLYLRNNATIGGTLTVDGRLTTFGTRFSGPGKLVVNGTWGEFGSSEWGIDTDIGSLGTVELRGSARLLTDVVIQTGGSLDWYAGGTLTQNPGEMGELQVEGRVESQDGTTSINVSVPTRFSGGSTLKNDFADMFFNRGLVIQSLTIDQQGGALSSATFNSDSSSKILIPGTLTINGNSPVNIGSNGDGDRVIEIDGLVRNRAGSQPADSAGLFIRSPITGIGRIDNTGHLGLRTSELIDLNITNNADAFVRVLSTARYRGLLDNAGFARQDNTMILDGGGIINSGSWFMDRSMNAAGTNPGLETFVNLGSLSVTGLSEFEEGPIFIDAVMEPALDNAGTVRVRWGRLTVRTLVGLQNETLTGGRWIAEENGTIVMPSRVGAISGSGTVVAGDDDGTPFLKEVSRVSDDAIAEVADIVFDGGVDVDDGWFEIRDASTAETQGDFQVRNGGRATVNGDATLKSSGPVEIGSEVSAPSVIDDLEGVIALARGARTVTPPTVEAPVVNLRGRLTPAVDGTGAFRVVGDLAMFDRGRLAVTVDQGGVSDFVEVTGSASLDGMIELELAMGYTPSLGDSFTVLTAGVGVSGAIDRVVVDTGTAGVRWVPSLVGNSLVVTATVPADLAAPIGTIDVFDLIAFLQGFDPNDPSCDGSVVPCSLGDLSPAPSGDGFLDVFDLIAFLQAFKPGPVGAGGGS